jgi:hypothetical protein
MQRLLAGSLHDPAPQPVVSPSRAPSIQTKMSVGPAGDRYEQEADQVARQVANRLHPSKSLPAPSVPSAKPQKTPQASPAAESASRQSVWQRPTGAHHQQGELTPEFAADIRRAQAGGQPLATPVRSAMEQAFGADFGAVRIHQSPQADALSRSIDARAFTLGQDVFFRQGAFQQDTVTGQGLLAHELTHVVQQSGGQVQRALTPEERLPSAQQSAASGARLDQWPQIVQRSQPGRIHRCGDDDKKTTTPDPASTSPKLAPPTSSGSPGMSGTPGSIEPISYAASKPTADPSTFTKDQTEAIQLINTSGIDPAYKARANLLIEVPDAIDQTAHGVCGMVAVLRAVVKSSPKRFAQMIISAMSDTALIAQWLPVFNKRADKDQKAKHAEVEFITSQWLVRKSATGDVSQKVMNKGGVTTKTKKYSNVFDAQVAFSNSFGIKGWENDLGHFATTTGGLNYLLNSVGSGKDSFKIKVTNFKQDYQAAKAKAGKDGSVIASVTNTDFYKLKGKEVDKPLVKSGGPKFRHWVMIDEVKESGDYFVLKLWTWAAHYFAKVHKSVIGTHIYSLIAAETDV